jgi:glutathione peroxidase-family protein
VRGGDQDFLRDTLKFLINRAAKVSARFAPPTKPVSEEIVSATEAIL